MQGTKFYRVKVRPWDRETALALHQYHQQTLMTTTICGTKPPSPPPSNEGNMPRDMTQSSFWRHWGWLSIYFYWIFKINADWVFIFENDSFDCRFMFWDFVFGWSVGNHVFCFFKCCALMLWFFLINDSEICINLLNRFITLHCIC